MVSIRGHCRNMDYQVGIGVYAIDHVVPLKRGGADGSGNMQWQTVAAGKAKDKAQ
jgi:hypothetical protein